MKYLKQLAVLSGLCVIGDILSFFMGHLIPGNVLGMLLLLALLCFKKLHLHDIRETSDFFLNNMAFFFIPACLGIIEVFPQIQDVFFPLLAVCVLTTFLTAAATALTVHTVLKIQDKQKS